MLLDMQYLKECINFEILKKLEETYVILYLHTEHQINCKINLLLSLIILNSTFNSSKKAKKLR